MHFTNSNKTKPMYLKLTKFCWNYKYILLFLALFYLVLTQRFLNDKTNGLSGSVAMDGTGYYYYLPASIIYHDFSYAFYDNPKNKIKAEHKPYLDSYINNTSINRYYCGTAICLLPFFLTACLISELAGTQLNGYTDTFLLMVSLASIFYFLISVYLILKVGLYFTIPEHTSFLISLVFLFGTNLIYYVIQEPSISHIYSFFAICLFYFQFQRLIKNTNLINCLLLSLCLGLIVLIRPPNIIALLFIPFFFQSFQAFIAFFKQLFFTQFKAIVISFCLFLACVFIQLLFYYIQTGSFIVMSYTGMSFDFEDPQIVNILFSYRKGLFLYAPLIFVALLFCLFFKGEWNKKISLFLTFAVFVYFTSSWWCWTYGGGFGNRPFVDIYPLILFSLLYFVAKLSSVVKRVALLLTLPFVFYNQVMAYQYSHRLMDTYGNTTEENYWDIFMRTDLLSINQNKLKRHILGKTPVWTAINTFEGTKNRTLESPGYKSNQACIVGKKNNFTSPYLLTIAQLDTSSDYFIKAECMAKADKDAKMLGLVISIADNGVAKTWEVAFFNQFEYVEGNWKYMNNISRISRFDLGKNTSVQVMAFSTVGNGNVDNFKCTVYKANP